MGTGAGMLAVTVLGAAWIQEPQAAMTAEDIFLDETIHQPTRLRVMTMLVSQSEEGRLAYGFIQKTLGLTGGNLTTHLRKLEEAGFVAISKEFLGTKPRTWVEATQEGRQAFAEYLVNLERALNWPN